MLTVLALIKALPGKEQVLEVELRKLVECTRIEEGCIRYDLHVSRSNRNEFMFFEHWESQEHLDRHKTTAHIQNFRTIARELVDGESLITVWDELDAERTSTR
jgi:quinol monooxygenase YgiN